MSSFNYLKCKWYIACSDVVIELYSDTDYSIDLSEQLREFDLKGFETDRYVLLQPDLSLYFAQYVLLSL